MKLFLLGFYGYNNIGDEALLSSILNGLKVSRQHQFKVLSYNAQETELQHNVEAVSRGKNFGIVSHIAKSDAIVVGGGSILQDITSSKSLYYYLTLLMASKLLGKKIFLLGNGFGPVNRPFNKWILKCFIPLVDGIITRDDDSYHAFKAYRPKRLSKGVDCVFTMDVSRVDAHVSKRPYIAISLRPWKRVNQVIDVVSRIISDLDQEGFDSVLIPMKSPDDSDVMASLLKLGDHVSMAPNEFSQILPYLKGASLVIGMRLHALILAATLGRPLIAISYDPKVDSFMKALLNKDVMNVDTINYNDLKLEIEHIILDIDKASDSVAHSVKAIKQIAQDQMQTFENWLK